ncbi:uncharacterized protein ACN427_010442 isoform 2-T2 [Glossina fuscipes fuscipes]
MRAAICPMWLAILSHVAPSTEEVESLSPLISSPLCTTVCNATLSYYPGVFNSLSADLYMRRYTFIA